MKIKLLYFLNADSWVGWNQIFKPCTFLGYIRGEKILEITLTERLLSCTFGPGDFQTMKWLSTQDHALIL